MITSNDSSMAAHRAEELPVRDLEMADGCPRLSVIVVNWNTRAHLERCLESLRQAAELVSAEVIVVDNCSNDGSPLLVQEKFPWVRLLALDRNLGFAGANNLGIRDSRGEYVLLLNPDVYAPRGSLAEMVNVLDARPDIAGAGASLIGADGRVQAEFYRRFPSRIQVLLFYTMLVYVAQLVPALRRRWFEHDLRGVQPVEVDQLPGACCLVRRTVIERVGLMDPDYFIWWEDVDWCYRMRAAGYRLFALPWVQMIHAGGASFDAWSIDRRISQFFRSYFRFLCKNRLSGLTAWSRAVIHADLTAKEWIIRLSRVTGIQLSGTLPDPENVRGLRGDIADLIDRHRRGELVSFADHEAPSP